MVSNRYKSNVTNSENSESDSRYLQSTTIKGSLSGPRLVQGTWWTRCQVIRWKSKRPKPTVDNMWFKRYCFHNLGSKQVLHLSWCALAAHFGIYSVLEGFVFTVLLQCIHCRCVVKCSQHASSIAKVRVLQYVSAVSFRYQTRRSKLFLSWLPSKRKPTCQDILMVLQRQQFCQKWAAAVSSCCFMIIHTLGRNNSFTTPR